MHPSATWAGVSLGRLLELSAAVIAALNPTLLIWSIVLVIVITVAVNSTIKRLAKRKPAVPRDITSWSRQCGDGHQSRSEASAKNHRTRGAACGAAHFCSCANGSVLTAG
jgi:hypothetical protein